MKIGLIDLIHDGLHSAPQGHPENSDRIQFALDYIKKSDIADNIVFISPTLADKNIIRQVHSPKYIDFLEQSVSQGVRDLDADTYLSSGSFIAAETTALASAGAVDIIMNGEYKSIFVAGRPPGHHAEYDHAMGFCLINNVAVAAGYAIKKHNLNRIAVVDWDVHHGIGTQNIFYNRSDLFFFSLHNYPFFPGTGRSTDIGKGEGEHFTVNIPLSGGEGDEVYLKKFEEIIIPKLENYSPEFIIISCGFDAHRDDPLGGMNLTENGFGTMTKMIKEIAVEYAEGRLLSLFEGGYSPTANGHSLYEHLKELI